MNNVIFSRESITIGADVLPVISAAIDGGNIILTVSAQIDGARRILRITIAQDDASYSEAYLAYFAEEKPDQEPEEKPEEDPTDEPKEAPEEAPEETPVKPDKYFIGLTITGKTYRIVFDGDANRTRVIFKIPPRDEIKKALESAKFFWSPTMKSWNKKLTFKAFRAAQALALRLNQLGA